MGFGPTDVQKLVILSAVASPIFIALVFTVRALLDHQATTASVVISPRFLAPLVGALAGLALVVFLVVPPFDVIDRTIDLSRLAKDVITLAVAGLIALAVAALLYLGLHKLRGPLANSVLLVAPVGATLIFLGIQSIIGDDPLTVRRFFEVEPLKVATGSNGGVVERVAAHLAFVTSLTSDSNGRILFTELQTGKVWVLEPEPDGSFEKRLFAEIPLPDGLGSEHGLWHAGLNRGETHLYVMAIESVNPDEGAGDTSRIVRFPYNNGHAGPMELVYSGLPAASSHNGGALTFGPDGNLYVSVGDSNIETSARDPLTPGGSILRLTPEGQVPDDNPFPGSPVFGYGLRSPYGIVFHPDTGKMYATDNGPLCCDRFLLVEPGKYHGWPDYGSKPEELALAKANPSVVAPLFESGDAAIAPTQLIAYSGSRYGAEFAGNLFFGTFLNGDVHRVVLLRDGLEVVSDEVVMEFQNSRPIIAMAATPNGYIYFGTPQEIYRINSFVHP